LLKGEKSLSKRDFRPSEKRKTQDKEKPTVLQDVRVLDMTWLGPGPFCTTLLSDLGAEVIKIHEPGIERRNPLIGFILPDSPDSPGLRNCKVMGLDLKSKDGINIFYELVKTADIIMESLRPGVTKRLGIDYKTVRRINSGIIYVSLTGYGQDGPYRDVAGHDINYISIGGLLGITGTRDGMPVIPGIPIADFAAGGMIAATAILAALRARDKTGKGQFADVSMTDGIVGMMSIWINAYLTWGVLSKKGETWLNGLWPWYNVYKTKDGKFISVGALEPWFYTNLCQLLGREDLIEHQFAEGKKRDEIFRFFRQTFLTKKRDEWVEILRQRDTCVAPVYSIDELVRDPQLLSRGIIYEMPHPVMGRVKQVGSIVKLSDSPFKVRNWSTRFGQHTAEILQELGYDKARITELREAEVIA
jgi:crotonobetainyl-CoA:carnitine CoA-transferase CaiB-like acyl-CoA transferase